MAIGMGQSVMMLQMRQMPCDILIKSNDMILNEHVLFYRMKPALQASLFSVSNGLPTLDIMDLVSFEVLELLMRPKEEQ